MKILLFTDTHMQNINYESVEYINNSRKTWEINDVKVGHYFYSQYKSFERVIEFAKEHNVDYAFHLGDVFNKDSINTLSFNLTNHLFKQLKDNVNISVWVMNGNHDSNRFNNELNSKIYSLKYANLVIDNPVILKLPSSNMFAVFMPYFKDTLKEKYDEVINLNDDEFKKSKKILFAHHDFTEIKKIYKGINVVFDLDEVKNYFEYMFFGHFHERNRFDSKTHIIGALNKTSGGFEPAQEYGICLLDIGENDVENIEYYNFNYFPYVFADYDELDDGIFNYCYDLKRRNKDCFVTLIIDVNRNLMFKEEFDLKMRMKQYENIVDRYKIRTFYDNIDSSNIKKIRMDSLKNIKSLFVTSVVKYLQLNDINNKDEIKEYVEYLKELMLKSLEK